MTSGTQEDAPLRPRPAFGETIIGAGVLVLALLAATAAAIVYRYLPHDIAQHGAASGPVEAVEDVAELAIAGVPPVFPDTPADEGRRRDGAEPLRVASNE
jgi:hypothetical protein